MENNQASAKKLRLSGVTRNDRLTCTASIRDIVVAQCHGWIGEFYQYSNISLCLHFEIPAGSLSVLRDSLRAGGVSLGRDSDGAFRDISVEEGNSEAIPCTLQITFIHNEPDLRRQVPVVPG